MRVGLNPRMIPAAEKPKSNVQNANFFDARATLEDLQSRDFDLGMRPWEMALDARGPSRNQLSKGRPRLED